MTPWLMEYIISFFSSADSMLDSSMVKSPLIKAAPARRDFRSPIKDLARWPPSAKSSATIRAKKEGILETSASSALSSIALVICTGVRRLPLMASMAEA